MRFWSFSLMIKQMFCNLKGKDLDCRMWFLFFLLKKKTGLRHLEGSLYWCKTFICLSAFRGLSKYEAAQTECLLVPGQKVFLHQDYLTIDHFSTLKWSNLPEAQAHRTQGAFGPSSHMASLLPDRGLDGLCRWWTALPRVSGPGSTCWWLNSTLILRPGPTLRFRSIKYPGDRMFKVF